MEPEKDLPKEVVDGGNSNPKKLTHDLERLVEQKPSDVGQETKREDFEGRFDSFLDEIRRNQRQLERPLEIHFDHTDAQANQKIRFGEVDLPISQLLDSPFVLEELLTLDGHIKDGRRSVEVVYDLVEAYRNREYDESKAKDPISVSLKRCDDGKFYYVLNGGRHRVAAAILSSQEQIRVDLNSTAIYLDSPEGDTKIEELKAMQVHTPRADQIRQNMVKYHQNDNAQVIL